VGSFEHAAWRSLRLLGGNAHEGFDFGTGQYATMASEVIVFLDDTYSLINGILLAFDGQTRIVQVSAELQAIFQQTHVFVKGTEERFQLSGDVYGALHPVGRLTCCPKWATDENPPQREGLN
jgi:hypothetical protein